MNNNKKRTLRFDLMDELEPTEVKKASDIIISKEDAPKDYLQWYEYAYDWGADLMFAITKDIARVTNVMLYINDFKDVLTSILDKCYGDDNYTEIQVISPQDTVLAKAPEGEIQFEPCGTKYLIDSLASFRNNLQVTFKVGIKKPKDDKRNVIAFANATASIYSLLKQKTLDSTHLFEVFPREYNKRSADDSNPLQPTDYFQICESQFGSPDNTFGPDFYYYKFGEVNTGYPTYMDDIKEEAKDSAAEMLRLFVIPVDFEFKAADIIYEWVMKYIKINGNK
jgi:hypothetical protein